MLPRLLAAGSLLALTLACAGGETSGPGASTPPPAGGPESASAPSSPGPGTPESAPAPRSPAPGTPATPTASTSQAGVAARPLYYERALTPADLEGRTLRELSLMRNTIFARAGQPFAKPWLDAWFRAQPWYTPREKQDLSVLTDVDRANVAAIVKAEQAFTREELLARRDAIQARGATSEEDRIELSLLGAALGEWSGADAVPLSARSPLEDPTVLDRQLTVAQLDGLSRRDLRLVRNTIYARRGRPFRSAALASYFADKSWYTPEDSFDEAMLAEVDKRNIQLVQSMEDRLGGPMREWEHQREEGWFEGA